MWQEPYAEHTERKQWKYWSGSTQQRSFKECKVLPGSDVRQTAGYMAIAMRNGSILSVTAASPEGLNQSVKAIALARSFLEDDGFDLTVRSSEPEKGEATVQLEVAPTADDWVREEIRKSEAKELIVSSESVPSRVAGAIAKSTREELQVFCTAMGPKAISRVAKSVSLARQYLEAEGWELCFVPEFAHTEDGASLMHIYIFPIFRDCLVRADSDVHQTAGYIAAGVRSCTPPVVVADSAASGNQAMKSLAVTRSYLEKEDLDIVVQPFFPDFSEDSSSCVMRLLVSVSDNSVREQLDSKQAMQLYVSSESDPGKVAGAIARSARSGGQICCTAMGPQAVLRAAKSVFLARRYLEADVIYPYIVPEFGKSSDGASVIHIHVLVHLSV